MINNETTEEKKSIKLILGIGSHIEKLDPNIKKYCLNRDIIWPRKTKEALLNNTTEWLCCFDSKKPKKEEKIEEFIAKRIILSINKTISKKLVDLNLSLDAAKNNITLMFGDLPSSTPFISNTVTTIWGFSAKHSLIPKAGLSSAFFDEIKIEYSVHIF